MNDLIRTKLKEIINFQDFIKTDELCYKWKHRKVYNISEHSSSIFLRDIHEEHFSLKDADDEQNNFAA